VDAARRLLIVSSLALGAGAAAVAAGAPDASNSLLLDPPTPAVLQARYDAARAAEERALARGDRRAADRARRDVAWAERFDHRPSGWRGAWELRRAPKPPAARAERVSDARLAARLAAIGRSYRGWAALWHHDLTSGAWAGWNADASFPAASLVKLGPLAAALRHTPRPERSPLWYDLRQLAGWSSNLAANRIVAAVGGERVVADALRRLGGWSSTYPGPYRAGTAIGPDASRPPAHGHWRVTTAHDLGRMLWTLNAAAAGNRSAQRRSGLTLAKARLALGLLGDAHNGGEHAGLIRPYVAARTRVVRKEGWISDFRGSAAIVYGPRPTVVVVLVYRPGVTLREARALARRAVALTLG
jgi:beta-lactamase class A